MVRLVRLVLPESEEKGEEKEEEKEQQKQEKKEELKGEEEDSFPPLQVPPQLATALPQPSQTTPHDRCYGMDTIPTPSSAYGILDNGNGRILLDLVHSQAMIGTHTCVVFRLLHHNTRK